ncbi:hypothetical protein F511_29841 [Dorcoceras hygrometricum]|uniref:Uncharacterized protein n=1 Tax=Dorcoceras hygrometricum TaxID=472368 RepID=A0A2Z7CG72_9LAMI|nr:hypothetical protein F511_29841 [Dorcoceras hygrometricum]
MKIVEEFAKVEDLLLPWEETEKVNELLQRRELIWYKMIEQHMRTIVTEHWKEFNKDKPSANQDLMSIRLLETELENTRRSVSLFQSKSGLPITFPERSTDRAASLEITPGISWQEYKAQLVQLTISTSAEQPAQGEEQQAQTEEPQVFEIEHQAQEQPAEDKTTAMIEQ